MSQIGTEQLLETHLLQPLPWGPHVYSKGFEYSYNFSGCVDSPPSAWFPLLLLLLLLKCKLFKNNSEILMMYCHYIFHQLTENKF